MYFAHIKLPLCLRMLVVDPVMVSRTEDPDAILAELAKNKGETIDAGQGEEENK